MTVKRTKLSIAAAFAALSVGVNILTPINTQAADDKSVNSNVGPAFLQVSPTKQRISIEPGSHYVSSFKVQNIGETTFSYKAYATPFNVINENYESDYSTRGTYSQISEWITFDSATETGTLDPNSEKEVSFTVNVPKDAPAGGQYAAIMAETQDGSSEANNIRTVNRVGMILYASIAGETKKEGQVLENKIPGFVLNPPLTATSLVENTGNVEATAEYTFKIWKLFDKETVYSNEDKKGSLDIMPGTKRFGTINWDGAPKIGVFWVEQTINYLGKTSTNKKLVIICPLWLLFLILAVIFFLVFWLVSRIRSRKQAKNGGESPKRSRSRRSLIKKEKKDEKKD
ncbi:hypothetical protein IJJ18_03200 [Candidatus Saccharibacteria bacterium]|nr:hypothetical protein [Candidatus Saccharibacteria bacterium]